VADLVDARDDAGVRALLVPEEDEPGDERHRER
jgi:hypothetical protein